MAGAPDDGIVVVDECEMSCANCGQTVTVNTRIEMLGTVAYTTADTVENAGEAILYETDDGQLCNECDAARHDRPRAF